MTTHILLLDPLEKLNIKKDSTLLLALSLKKLGKKVFLLFKKDLYFTNIQSPKMKVYDFKGSLYKDSFYLQSFELENNPQLLNLDENTTLHMRLDPPFDLNYLKSLWILQALKMYGINVINDSSGILNYNEKLYAYSHAKKKFPSFLGESEEMLKNYLHQLSQQGVQEIILKPVDLFQGVGVEKRPLNEEIVLNTFKEMKKEYFGAIVVQPFAKSVAQGEIRSIFFDNVELGTILKVPPPGSHLANIAQGAQFQAIPLSPSLKEECETINKDLSKVGVRWTAFDILDNTISEVNITCPGLLVETSIAMKSNLADAIAQVI